jgi:hypothetical protein
MSVTETKLYSETLVSDEAMRGINGFTDNLMARAKEVRASSDPLHTDVVEAYSQLHDWVEANCDGRYSSASYTILALAMEDAMGTGAVDAMFPESMGQAIARLRDELSMLRRKEG